MMIIDDVSGMKDTVFIFETHKHEERRSWYVEHYRHVFMYLCIYRHYRHVLMYVKRHTLQACMSLHYRHVTLQACLQHTDMKYDNHRWCVEHQWHSIYFWKTQTWWTMITDDICQTFSTPYLSLADPNMNKNDHRLHVKTFKNMVCITWRNKHKGRWS